MCGRNMRRRGGINDMALDWPAINKRLTFIVKSKEELLEKIKSCTPDADALLKAYGELEDEQDAILALVIREGREPFERPYLH